MNTAPNHGVLDERAQGISVGMLKNMDHATLAVNVAAFSQADLWALLKLAQLALANDIERATGFAETGRCEWAAKTLHQAERAAHVSRAITGELSTRRSAVQR